jgi:hypothetical protein
MDCQRRKYEAGDGSTNEIQYAALNMQSRKWQFKPNDNILSICRWMVSADNVTICSRK